MNLCGGWPENDKNKVLADLKDDSKLFCGPPDSITDAMIGVPEGASMLIFDEASDVPPEMFDPQWPVILDQDGLEFELARTHGTKYHEDGGCEVYAWQGRLYVMEPEVVRKKDPEKSTFTRLEVDQLIVDAGFRNSDLEFALKHIREVVNDLFDDA